MLSILRTVEVKAAGLSELATEVQKFSQNAPLTSRATSSVMMDYISGLPDELLLEISFALGRKDRLNFACTSHRVHGTAIEALFCDIGPIPQYLIPWYISRISQNRKWAEKVRHVKIRQSRHDAICHLSYGTVQGCNQALRYVLNECPSSQALVQEIEEVLSPNIPQTTTQDASSLSLLLLMVLGNVEQLTLMLHSDPSHHQEVPILEWDDYANDIQHLKLLSLSIFCAGNYTGLKYHDILRFQHINSVTHVEIGTDVLAMIEPAHFPPHMSTLDIFERTSLCNLPFDRLAKLVHRLRQIRVYFVCPDICKVEMKDVYMSLAEIEDVVASSTTICRMFYTVEELKDGDQFKAASYTKELPRDFKEKLMALRASVHDKSLAGENGRCLIRQQDDPLVSVGVDCSTRAEQQPDLLSADNIGAKERKHGSVSNDASLPAAPHSLLAPAVSANPIHSSSRATYPGLESRASLSPQSSSERPSVQKAAASRTSARKVATVHLPSTDSNGAAPKRR